MNLSARNEKCAVENKTKWRMTIMKKLLTLAVAAAMTLSVAAASATTLKLSEVHAEGYPTTLADQEFARLIEEKTEGRIKVEFSEGESVFDVLQHTCRERGIHMESSWTPIYNSAYVEGIANLYEFDVGSQSGWMYKVNGWFPNYGCSRYQLQNGDVIEWVYTCDLGDDVGGGYATGSE